MRAVMTSLLAFGLLIASSSTALAVEEIGCGHVMGYAPASGSTPASFVIQRPGDTPPSGFYVAVPTGTTFTPPASDQWVCVRTNVIPAVTIYGGNTATHEFVNFVQPGQAGYVASPTPAPGPSATGRDSGVGSVGVPPGASQAVGQLPSTSTSSDAAVWIVVACALALIAAAAIMRPRQR